METSDVPKSAQEVFEKNTIPGVRTIEKQLRAYVSRDQERLRALVGGNYRDLLSTAEEIVTLGSRTKEAEEQISDLSQQCRPQQQRSITLSISPVSSISAQLHLLTQCISCAFASLQSRSVLLCAELTVITRLLLKSLADYESPPKSVEHFRNRAASLRRRLLRLIKSQLAHPASSVEVLVQSICAYCLVTSASSGDAVAHFQNVRLEKLRQRVNDGEESQDRIKENFRYLIVSVQSLKSLLGRSVNDALTLLQKQPILQDHDILKLETLDVDRLQNLIPQDILGFTPYIKRVLLKQNEVQQISSAWNQEACQVFGKGLSTVLANITSVVDVFGIRKDLCTIVLPVYFSTPARETLLETLRNATNARVLELCATQIGRLVEIGERIVSTDLHSNTEAYLWDPDLTQRTLTTNSAGYVRQVCCSHLGTKGDLSISTIKSLRKWAKHVGQLRSQFQNLESTRWHDILEEPDDEDEDTAQEIVSQLSKDDPAHFKDAMDSALQSTVTSFNRLIDDAISQASESGDSSTSTNSPDQTTGRIVYLLRSLRESSAILITVVPQIPLNIKTQATTLQEALADHITHEITTTLLPGVSVQRPSSYSSSLPDDLPSPSTFKLLRDTCNLLARTGGTDIWSETALSILKAKLRSALLDVDQEKKSMYIHSLFDEYYLTAAFSSASSIYQPSRSAAIKSSTSEGGDASIKTKADAYWARTKLLFGVLSA